MSINHIQEQFQELVDQWIPVIYSARPRVYDDYEYVLTAAPIKVELIQDSYRISISYYGIFGADSFILPKKDILKVIARGKKILGVYKSFFLPDRLTLAELLEAAQCTLAQGLLLENKELRRVFKHLVWAYGSKKD